MAVKRTVFLLALALVFFACRNDHNKAGKNEFLINGYFANAKQNYVFLEELQPRKLVRIDSVIIDEKGKFVFRRILNETGFYLVKLAKDNFITLLLDKGETLDLTADASDLARTYRVKGSVGSELLKDWNVFLRTNTDRTDSLAKKLLNSQEKPDFLQIKKGLDSTYKAILANVRAKAIEFIDKNPKSLASLIVLYQYFGNKALFNEKDDLAIFEKLDNSLKTVYPKSEHVSDLDKIVSEVKKDIENKKTIEKNVSVGSPAPDIVMPAPDSTLRSLSSLKGKVVLVDFWASWCVPCRMQHPELVKLYNKYHKRGFEIFGVSLDKIYEPWIDAIERDYLYWINVCDYKYWKSPVINLYNIDKIPFNVLVDRKGIIVAKNLSIGDLARTIPIYLPGKKDSLKTVIN
jgi:thiol-disulfide isomerase/thioredoxin